MAVIKELLQIKISVWIAGSEDDCVEYDDPDPPRTPASSGDAAHSISKVIESQDNAEYSICCEMDNSLSRAAWTALQIGGIIPSDPSPPQERPTVEGMDLVEIKRLAQERLEQMQDAKPIKREASCEVNVRPRKVYKTDVDGTVDLTED
ncbi:hypothetical protein CPLU01_01096 [Colletotrichum plurivorum]|uniref:Uncharacterized protein n=1 Tax=Colletotrichum plurivorum TaxID=2175906 RepID=A0A8H6NPZ4_9PEZI|nr:hypothetical protein CPLU01_01096 [Colletotrichum plurivorum]